MRYFTIVLLVLTVVSVCFTQTPNMVHFSRWYFDGVPGIQGLTTIKENGMPNKVWFTESDSHKVGYVSLSMCKDAKLLEYKLGNVWPYKIAYAEKPFALHIGKKAYKSNVWFTTTNEAETLHTIIADTKNTFLISYPTTILDMSPSLLRWQAADKNSIAQLWFTDWAWDDNKIYSFSPLSSPTEVLPALISAFQMRDTGTITALKVQNDIVWAALHGANDTIYLYAKPVIGGTVTRWVLGTDLGTGGERDIQPVYNKNSPKPFELPYQVWVVSENGVAIVRLDQNSKQPTDSLCISLFPDGNYARGLFSSPTTMKKKATNWTFLLTTYEPDSDYVSILRAKAYKPIQRTSFMSQPMLVNSHGTYRQISTATTTIKHACGYRNLASTQQGCMTDDWKTQYEPVVKLNFFQQLGPVDIKGKTTATHFDLMFHEYFATLDGVPATSTLDWMSGSYSSVMQDASSMNDEQSMDEVNVTGSKFALDEAYPNPFNPSTVINYSLPTNSIVTLKVYNMLGQEVATLINQETMDEGSHSIEFNASSFPSGMYFCRIVANEVGDDSEQSATTHTAVKKLLLMK